MPRRSLYYFPPTLLAAWGGAFLYLAVSGKLRALLNPLFWPLEIGCAIVLLALAAAYLVLFRPVGVTPRGASAAPQLQIWKAAVLLIPLLGAAVLAPRSFSAAALEARAGLSGGKILAQAGTGTAPGADLQMVDLAAAAYYPENIPHVTGRKVKYLGQYLLGKPGEFRFCRVLMSCCAADATPIYLHIIGNPPPQVTQMGWITVEGETFFRKDDGDWTPCVKLASVTPAQAPPDPYLYAVRMKAR